MPGTSTTQLALTAFDLFQDEQRIRVLELLLEAESPFYCRELILQFQEQASEPAPSEADLLADFHHVHLPIFDEAGVIDYEREQLCVTQINEEKLDALLEATRIVVNSLTEE
ncbi:DUF7344 domain-containing protein [Haloarcula nitratireducens]|uniref:DUF7344 domain-containing protein n=1 Tax=Haloarcula nitratireducens TaxID=2487749 RepID=A0AAW4PIM9_9EURY|nr:hypothetical protein [Halomicroarcula nitratireducens]MBX0297072.1 hypothetical protein [Halomicroarcula nitratireducens]